MKKRISNIVVSLFLFTSMVTQAQIIPANDNILAQQYPFVRTVYNRISNAGNLDSFFKKLYQLKTTNTGVVSIVHIGDSHIQADFFSGILRDGLQDFFGNAGRGLVFPYQLAKSNAPQDISSSSSTNWQFNRLAHPEISIPYGVSGYGLITNAANANISLSLKPEAAELSSFDHLKFFLDSNTTTSWIVQADNNTDPYLLKKEQGDTSLCQQIILDEASSGFLLSSLPSGRSKEFYGVSLENSDPGIIYHTLGVNGARYDQYNIASLFWKQLPALKADLYIVSLGTNEAQAASFSETTFSKQLTIFIQKLKQASPGAAILITTAPDSYKKKHFNTVLRQLNNTIGDFCSKNDIPFWDLYHITGGYGSAYSWAHRGLMRQDRIHFTAEGYRLQGKLLLTALAKSYNSYQNSDSLTADSLLTR